MKWVELIWLPGFVDTHVHYPQHRVRARSSGELLPWLNQTIFPKSSVFGMMSTQTSWPMSSCSALLSHGTTCAQIYSSSHETYRFLISSSLPTRFASSCWHDSHGRGAPDELCIPTELAKSGMERLTTRWHEVDNGRLRYVVTPRFALSCSPAMLEMAGRYAQEHALAIQTHLLSENQAEIEAVRHTFPDISDYLGVYESFHLLKESSLFAHCIHLTDDEWARIADAGGAISHCPDSNFFLGSGVFPGKRLHTIRSPWSWLRCGCRQNLRYAQDCEQSLRRKSIER